MRVIRWCIDHWYIPLFTIAAVGGAVFLIWRKKPALGWLTKVQVELGAIEAKREARDIRLQLGADQAKQHVLDKYAEKRKSLDAKTEARMKELEDDPEALAKALERLTRN